MKATKLIIGIIFILLWGVCVYIIATAPTTESLCRFTACFLVSTFMAKEIVRLLEIKT